VLACDFFTVETLALQRIYVLFFLSLATRRVEFIACTPNPDRAWVTQQARNLVMQLGDQERRFRLLIHDRDSNFSHAFDEVFRSQGIEVIRTPVLAPNANANAERWVRTVRSDCLDRIPRRQRPLTRSAGHPPTRPTRRTHPRIPTSSVTGFAHPTGSIKMTCSETSSAQACYARGVVAVDGARGGRREDRGRTGCASKSDQRTAWHQRLQAQLFQQGVAPGLKPRTRAGREALARARRLPPLRQLRRRRPPQRPGRDRLPVRQQARGGSPLPSGS
jgi:hypothetical protein